MRSTFSWLNIPVVRSIMACPARKNVYSGTLAGFFVSDNKGMDLEHAVLFAEIYGMLHA